MVRLAVEPKHLTDSPRLLAESGAIRVDGYMTATRVPALLVRTSAGRVVVTPWRADVVWSCMMYRRELAMYSPHRDPPRDSGLPDSLGGLITPLVTTGASVGPAATSLDWADELRGLDWREATLGFRNETDGPVLEISSETRRVATFREPYRVVQTVTIRDRSGVIGYTLTLINESSQPLPVHARVVPTLAPDEYKPPEGDSAAPESHATPGSRSDGERTDDTSGPGDAASADAAATWEVALQLLETRFADLVAWDPGTLHATRGWSVDTETVRLNAPVILATTEGASIAPGGALSMSVRIGALSVRAVGTLLGDDGAPQRLFTQCDPMLLDAESH